MSVVTLLGSSRQRVRAGAGTPPMPGTYTGPRYQPRFPLPDGVTYDTTLGYTTGVPTGVQVSYTPPANEVLLTDQGSVAANRTLLQTTITNAGTDAVRIRLAPVTTNWGDMIALNAYHVGVGLYIEPASVKDGGFVRAEGQRIQPGDTGLAPFVVDGDYAWSAPGGNQFLRCAFFPGASAGNFRFTGLDLSVKESWSVLTQVVGGGGPFYGSLGLIGNDHGVGNYNDRVTVDRCKIRGPEDKRWQRGTYINGSRIAHINNYVTNIHTGGQDGQGILCTEGGPFHLIENNWINCAYGENWMYGGGDDLYLGDGSPDFARVMTDIVVRRNVLNFPAEWVARGYLTKNLGEWKGGIRSLTERNIFRGYSLANGSLQGQFHSYVVKYSTAATRHNITRLCRFEQCEGFVGMESVREWELAHLLWDTAGMAPRDIASNDTLLIAGFSEYAGFPPGAVTDGRARGLKVHDLTTARSPRTDQINARWMGENDPDGPRENWEVENNVAILADQPLDGYQDSYLTRLSGGSGLLSAAADWARRDNTTSTWTGNVIAGPNPLRTTRVIPGDTTVPTAADLQLDAQYRPQAGSPALGKGCDIDLLNAALVGVETGL